MRKLILLLPFCVLPCGCQMNGQQQYAAQPYGQPVASQFAGPAGYEQTFPPQVQAASQFNQLGTRGGQFLGNLAGGFFRSAVGGAGFRAGNDLWNAIVD